MIKKTIKDNMKNILLQSRWLILSILLIGCVGTSVKYKISDPLPSDHYINFGASRVKIDNKDIVIYVNPRNDEAMLSADVSMPLKAYKTNSDFRFSEYYWKKFEVVGVPPFFLMEILLEVSSDGYSFNPILTSVDINNEKNIQAERCFVYPDVRKPPKHNTLDLIDYDAQQAGGKSCENEYVLQPGQRIAFLIRFETPPPQPETIFTILLKGLKRNGRIVLLPNVNYANEKVFDLLET